MNANEINIFVEHRLDFHFIYFAVEENTFSPFDYSI